MMQKKAMTTSPHFCKAPIPSRFRRNIVMSHTAHRSTFSRPVVLVRHGATDWNEAARYQGSTETSLNGTGQKQVVEVCKGLVALVNNGVLDKFQLQLIHSPLKRASQSAAIIADALQLPSATVSIDRRLRELSMGRWEGLDSAQVKDRFYEERKSRKNDRWGFCPEGGDSLASRCDEVAACLGEQPPHTIIVAHAGILRIAHHLLGGRSEPEAAALAIPHEEIAWLDSDGWHTLTTRALQQEDDGRVMD